MVKRIAYLLMLLILFSCKKEENDDQGPTISISSPTDNQSFTALQSFTIQGAVSDDNNISSITISLRNANNIKVLSSISKTPNTTSYQLNEAFVLDDLYLPSGSYTLKISASDGFNQTDKYIPLLINEYPKIRNGLFVFSNTGSTNQAVKLSNTFVASSFSSAFGDFLGGVVNSYYQEVITCPNYSGDLISTDIMTAGTNWSVANFSAAVPNFTGIAKASNEVFIAYYNGNIRSYFNNNTSNYTGTAFASSYARKMFKHDNLLITEQPEISGGKIRLVSYYVVSGAIKDNVELNENVVEMFSFSTNEVVVFTNTGVNGSIKLFNLSTNAIWQPFALGAGLITSCTEISNGIYLIAQNGNLIQVNYNNFTYSTYLSGVGANLVKYDSITNEVVVTNGNVLTNYDYSTKSVKSTYTHSSTILAFDFWYNK